MKGTGPLTDRSLAQGWYLPACDINVFISMVRVFPIEINPGSGQVVVMIARRPWDWSTAVPQSASNTCLELKMKQTCAPAHCRKLDDEVSTNLV